MSAPRDATVRPQTIRQVPGVRDRQVQDRDVPEQRAQAPRVQDRKVEEAEAIAIEALSFLATDSGRLQRFLSVTGLTRQTLRGAAGSPGFLAAVMEHVAADPTLVETYAANAGREPADVARAREILTGHQPWVST